MERRKTEGEWWKKKNILGKIMCERGGNATVQVDEIEETNFLFSPKDDLKMITRVTRKVGASVLCGVASN